MNSTPDNSTDNSDETTRDERSAESDEAGSSADVKAPFAPHEDDDSPLGDTDQHSTA